METTSILEPTEPALHISACLPRSHFRKLKKQEKRKHSRRDAASQRQILNVQEGTEEGMDIDQTEEPEHAKQRKLWEVREEAFNKSNAIRRQIEETERKKREIIQVFVGTFIIDILHHLIVTAFPSNSFSKIGRERYIALQPPN